MSGCQHFSLELSAIKMWCKEVTVSSEKLSIEFTEYLCFYDQNSKACPSVGRHKYSRMGPVVNYLTVYDYTCIDCSQEEKPIVNHTDLNQREMIADPVGFFNLSHSISKKSKQ